MKIKLSGYAAACREDMARDTTIKCVKRDKGKTKRQNNMLYSLHSIKKVVIS